MKRTGSAVWKGDLKGGAGSLSTHSGVLDTVPYSFRTRFEDEPGTNPEELIGAAHAACFSMALSNELAQAGMTPESVATTATVELVPGTGITGIHLRTNAKVPGAAQDAFDEIAQKAKEGCPVSGALSVPITLEAMLES